MCDAAAMCTWRDGADPAINRCLMADVPTCGVYAAQGHTHQHLRTCAASCMPLQPCTPSVTTVTRTNCRAVQMTHSSHNTAG